MQDGDFVLTESAVIAEYLINKYGKPDTLAVSPEQRAEIQIFFEQVAPKAISGMYGLLRAQTPEAQEKASSELRAAAAGVSKAYEKHGGPYFLGSKVSLADILVYPFFLRYITVKHYRGFELPDTPEFAALHKFIAAFQARDSAAKTSLSNEEYVRLYQKYTLPA
jgi:glutathione S-transferase